MCSCSVQQVLGDRRPRHCGRVSIMLHKRLLLLHTCAAHGNEEIHQLPVSTRLSSCQRVAIICGPLKMPSNLGFQCCLRMWARSWTPHWSLSC